MARAPKSLSASTGRLDLAMSVDLSGVAGMRTRFEAYGAKTFPRAVRYALNRIAEVAARDFSGQLPEVLSSPVAQQAWLGVAHDAAKLLRPTLEAELAEKMRHEASKAWKR